MSLDATEYILFFFKNRQYHYEATYWGFYFSQEISELKKVRLL